MFFFSGVGGAAVAFFSCMVFVAVAAGVVCGVPVQFAPLAIFLLFSRALFSMYRSFACACACACALKATLLLQRCARAGWLLVFLRGLAVLHAD